MKAKLAIVAVVLAAAFAPVVLRQATLVPHAAGIFHDGPPDYGVAPPQSVLDPWASVWMELPLARLVHGQAKRGVPPLWNPHTACGTPLAAGMHAQAFSPFRWPLFFVPEPVCWDLYFLARLLAAGLLAALLCFHLGLGVPAALAGGCGYMLSGYLVAYLNVFHLDVDVFLPGLLLCIARISAGGGLGWSALMALLTAQMLLGGNPQAAAIDFAFALLFASALVWGKPGGLAGRAAWRWAGAALTGLALAAPLLLPFAEFFRVAFHVHHEGVGTWWGGTSLPWEGIPALLVPTSFGPVFRPQDFPVQALLPYLGAGVFLLAVQGAGWGGFALRRVGWLLAGVILLELAKIYGVPPLNWLGRLSVFSLVVWVKYAAPLYLSAAMLAAVGIERLSRGEASARRFLWSVAALFLAGSLSLGKSGFRPEAALGWAFALLISVAWGSLMFRRAWRRTAGRRRQGRVPLSPGWLALALLCSEMIVWVPGQRARPHDPLEPAPYVKFLQEKAGGPCGPRVFGAGFNMVPHVNAAFGLNDPRTVDALIFEPYWRYMHEEVAEARAIPYPHFLLSSRLDERALTSLSFMGVRYIFSTRSPPDFLAAGVRWPLRRVFAGRMRVYENQLALPRAFMLYGKRWRPARIVACGSMEAVVETSKEAGLLVMTDAAYPGWRAVSEGGERLPISPYLGVFRSVKAGGATGRITFRYVPVSFALGLFLACSAGLGGLLCMLALSAGLPRAGGRRR